MEVFELNNNLNKPEKPYMSKEEKIMYTRIAIDEAIKQGNNELANYYSTLLALYEASDNSLTEFIIENGNAKK